MRALLLGAALTGSLGGCAGMAFRSRDVPSGIPTGMLGMVSPIPLPDTIYTDSVTPGDVTGNTLTKKKGEACATSILGLVTTGDASLRAAADAGGIEAIGAVDSTYTNILGIYAKLCTVVSGGEPRSGAAPATGGEATEVTAPAPTEPAPAEPAPAPAEPAPSEGTRPPSP